MLVRAETDRAVAGPQTRVPGQIGRDGKSRTAHERSNSRVCNTPLAGAIEPKNAPPQIRVKLLISLQGKVPKAPALDTVPEQQARQFRRGQRPKFRPILIARRRSRIRPRGGMG